MLVVKKFDKIHKRDYQRERDMYMYIKRTDCGDLFLNLIKNGDDKNILIMERGICDLKKFAELRREADNTDGPITPLEIIVIMEYVAEAMHRLWRDAGVCLCDNKE